jgi:isopentenyldiphosphate isomerase
MDLTLFPTFNPLTGAFLFNKERFLVHREGDWHTAIQANIIKPNHHGSYDILVQERSASVDIGGNKYDQSLATQMCSIDNFSTDATLKRGLLSELGIDNYESTKIPHNMYIVKTYSDQPEILNRELLNLYIVKLNQDQLVSPTTSKIKNLYWMEWNEFLNFFDINKEKFTKTGYFYFSDKKILNIINIIQNDFLNHFSIQSRVEDCSFFHINKSNEKELTYYINNSELQNYNYLFDIK